MKNASLDACLPCRATDGPIPGYFFRYKTAFANAIDYAILSPFSEDSIELKYATLP